MGADGVRLYQAVTADTAPGWLREVPALETLRQVWVQQFYAPTEQVRWRAAEDLPVLVGQQIPGYQLLEQIGQGAMGTVYKARQLSMDRIVAIKVLHSQLAADPKYLERFTREAHLAATLSSNNVVQAIDVGSAGAIQYFVMEYVEGTTIKRELDRGKVYGEEEAVEIVLQVAQALQQAHRRRLVHRDIKPANIILTKEGVAKLADLGMARETVNPRFSENEQGMTMGTPLYMSPEQIQTADVDSRTDIYSLGAVLYRLVTGGTPFAGDDAVAIAYQHVHEPPIPPRVLRPELANAWESLILRALAKDPNERFQTAVAMARALEALPEGDVGGRTSPISDASSPNLPVIGITPRMVRYDQRRRNARWAVPAVIVLIAPSNRIADLLPLMPSVHAAVATIQPGDLVEIRT